MIVLTDIPHPVTAFSSWLGGLYSGATGRALNSRSRGRGCVTTLDRLFVRPCGRAAITKQYNLVRGKRAVTICGREGNRGFGIALAMCCRYLFISLV